MSSAIRTTRFVRAMMLSGAAIIFTEAAAGGSPLNLQGFHRVAGGIVVRPVQGPASKIEVTVHGDSLFHVVATPRSGPSARTPSLMVPAPPTTGRFSVTEQAGHVRIKAARATADIDVATGRVEFLDPAGRVLLQEAAAPHFTPTRIDGKPYVSASQQFNRNSDEGFYGLGQHQYNQMDYNGEDVELAQHNLDIAVPFVLSTRGYGVLWDNNGVTRFGNPRPYQLVGDDLMVTSEGKPGFTARYYLGERPVLVRQEKTIGYQYLDDLKRYPEIAKSSLLSPARGSSGPGKPAEQQRVVWTGEMTSQTTGIHKFQLYASNFQKLYIDGELAIDRWRASSNPWYDPVAVPMTAGKPVRVRIEWTSNTGYMAFLHNNPMPAPDRHSLWMTSDVAQAVNYWFVPGGSMDGAIAGYRRLTGKAVLLPKWSYGFWQSRQRYQTAAELTDVVKQYRRRGIPLDNIVQDWFYWPEDQWGSHMFERSRFPDPKAMVGEIHANHAQVMVSVWAKFYTNTANYRELAAKDHIYQGNVRMGNKDRIGPGYLNSYYDPYSAQARQIYWRQVKDRLASLDFDALWLDSDEPDIHPNLSVEQRASVMGPTAMGPSAEFFNSYPLMHVTGVYEGWRAFKPDVRPFLLTRSGFGGLQRLGAAVWSGDTSVRWEDFHSQIAAGVNMSMSGMPNWTHDIGGFNMEARFSTPTPTAENLDEFRELQLRWFQFGVFSPIYRSHGEFPNREIYEVAPEGSPMRASMLWYNELRYRLMPYIYTAAADTWFRDASIMRGIMMDWPDDLQARKIDDEYMFGDALLVAPVTKYRARERAVYLPGTARWYDFYSGQSIAGGTTVKASAPADRIPLYVREGAIIPTGTVQQYVDQRPDAPITLNIYSGATGRYSLYDDDGRSEQYRRGAFARIPVSYDDRSGTVRIGAREGKGYKGMPPARTINIRWMTPGRPLALDEAADASVVYTGAAVAVRRSR